MAKTIRGFGKVETRDFKTVVFEGKTKGGVPVAITLNNAINMGDLNWVFADKGEVVDQIVFTGTYTNTDAMSTIATEPWSIEIDDTAMPTGAASIMLGSGVLKIDDVTVALVRGGGTFNTGRVFREINADGDRGAVKDRVVMDEARPTLTMNVLTILPAVEKLYTSVYVQ